jgi:hypothetical protein
VNNQFNTIRGLQEDFKNLKRIKQAKNDIKGIQTHQAQHLAKSKQNKDDQKNINNNFEESKVATKEMQVAIGKIQETIAPSLMKQEKPFDEATYKEEVKTFDSDKLQNLIAFNLIA